MCAGLSVVGMGVVAYRLWRPPVRGVAFVIFTVMVASFGITFYWNHPDSVMALGCVGVVIGLFCVSYSIVASVLVALSAALVINGKIHGLLYLLPLLPLGVRGRSTRWIVGTVLLSGVVISIPFWLPGISLTGYMEWLQVFAHHPFKIRIFIENIVCSLGLLIPIGVALQLKSTLTNVEKASLGILIGTMILVSIIGSKEGSGSGHLLLFVPSLVMLFGIICHETVRGTVSSHPFFWSPMAQYHGIKCCHDQYKDDLFLCSPLFDQAPPGPRITPHSGSISGEISFNGVFGWRV